MERILKIVLLISFCIAFSASCKKDVSLEGEYIGKFNGIMQTDNGIVNRYHEHKIMIKKSKRHYIVVGAGAFEKVLTKNENSVYGVIGEFESIAGAQVPVIYSVTVDGPIKIDGTWNIENGKYYISGTYESIFTFSANVNEPEFQAYPVTGTFEIVPKY